jgi:signal transduction histidine kinase
MQPMPPPIWHRDLLPTLTWRRLARALPAALLYGLIAAESAHQPLPLGVGVALVVVAVAVLAFSALETWPRRLPRWSARWAVQLAGVFIAIPVGAALALARMPLPPFGQFFRVVFFLGVLLGPWIALATMVRARDALAQRQQLQFDLERERLERSAGEARARLLQAQVQPHFLFNTLANVQALVDLQSPQAGPVLAALVAYLRAAVPRLDDSVTTVSDERDLVRAYLALMQMRMPDRLTWRVAIDPAALALRCPPLTLQALVENAVRHGIDPSEEGGTIDVQVRVHDQRCAVRVSDTGIGLAGHGGSGGSGLASLRERLQLLFGAGAVSLVTRDALPHGCVVELDFPAQMTR